MQTGSTKHLSTNEFSDQLANALAGDVIVYATGELGWDSMKPQGHVLVALKHAVWRQYEDGQLTLTQRRVGEHCFEYRAHKLCRPVQSMETKRYGLLGRLQADQFGGRTNGKQA